MDKLIKTTQKFLSADNSLAESFNDEDNIPLAQLYRHVRPEALVDDNYYKLQSLQKTTVDC